MYKLLAVDMDGTLLNNNKEISKRNIVAIGKARDMGVKIVLCTGRAHQGIEKYLKELELMRDDHYSATCSGAYVLNNTRSDVLKCNTFSVEDIRVFQKIAKEIDIKFNMFTDRELLILEDSFFSYYDSKANNLPTRLVELDNINDNSNITKVTFINEDLSVKDSIVKLFENVGEDEKNSDIYIRNNDRFKKNLFDDLSKLPDNIFDNYTLLKTSPYTVEVLSKEANKGMGVKVIADKFHIRREEVICIGDSGNDKHMIEYAGLGIAMDNAFEEIKAIADYITYDNENDGVAHVIDEFILN
ncbi:Cof-type HAD-IIB family hydrolase [Clostridium sp. DL1XJH146]